ncbi:hypothetical protein D3C71_868260 [compost metagenome]
MLLNVFDSQLHMPWRDLRGRVFERLREVVRPGFQHRINQHFLKARRHQRARVHQQVEFASRGQFHQGLDALEGRCIQVHHRLETQLVEDRFAQQRRESLGEQRSPDRHAVVRMIIAETHRANVGLVDRQANLGKTDRLSGVIENDLAGGRNDEGDFVQRGRKVNAEVATVVHAAKADAFVPAVDAADDDAARQRRCVSVKVAEHLAEQRAKVVAAHVVGPEDDLLAGRA